MKSLLILIAVMVAGLALAAQTLERPAGTDSNAMLAARERDLTQAAQQIRTLERAYQAALQAAKSHPEDLNAQAHEAGGHVQLLQALLDREEVEIKYMTLEAKAATDVADRLAAGTHDPAIQEQITDLSAKLADSKSRLRELLQAAQNSRDADAQQRLSEAVARTEALQGGLELFARAKQHEDDAQNVRESRVATLRAAAADAQRAAESHSYREIAIRATMASRMVDAHSIGEEMQARDIEAAVKTMVSSPGDDALENKYVLHPTASPSGTIEDRARLLLGDDDSKTPPPSQQDPGSPQQ